MSRMQLRMATSLSMALVIMTAGACASWAQSATAKKETIHRCLLAIYTAERSPEAANEFAALLALKPTDGGIHCDYGNYLIHGGNTSGAIAQYRKAVALQPRNADYQGGLGAALMMVKDYDGAVAAFRKAVEAGPSTQNWSARLNQAIQYQQQARQYNEYQKQLKDRESN